MILCLDVGNSTIHGGVYRNIPNGLAELEQIQLVTQFRRTSEARLSSDEIGLFLRSALRENGVDPESIAKISICTVVPDIMHSLRGACSKYFHTQPFQLQAGTRTGLKIKYRNPLEVGTDRIANAIAGTHLFPNQNLIVIDFGTATTFDVISHDREYLGGVILAGLRLSIEALESRTAKLPSVEITKPPRALGRSTVENIQSGLFYGYIGQIKELTSRLSSEAFSESAGNGAARPKIIATGGFSGLFETTGLFDRVIPDLVLKGLLIATQMNLNLGETNATQHAQM
jgi:type III pantothenate kinase